MAAAGVEWAEMLPGEPWRRDGAERADALESHGGAVLREGGAAS
jgi:hypothetical protein